MEQKNIYTISLRHLRQPKRSHKKGDEAFVLCLIFFNKKIKIIDMNI